MLAGSIGYGTAKYFVKQVATLGVKAAANYLAGYFAVGGALSGPLGFIIGSATGWL